MYRWSVACLLSVLVVLSCGPAMAQADPQATELPGATQLQDVEVRASSLQARAESFIASVGSPVAGRKLALWSGTICVGAAGLRPDASRLVVDRILDWGHSLGIRTGSPDCRPNILIVFADDGDAMAKQLVRARRLDFNAGVSGSQRGNRALRDFESSGRPVRWWPVSIPVDPDSGLPIVRTRGQAPFTSVPDITRPSDLGAFGQITMASRLYDDTLDAMQSMVIVVDRSALERADLAQLADYLSMVALAQIEPDTRPTAPSILTLFDDEDVAPPSLSVWDRAFLQALYGTHQRNVSAQADSDLIARSLARELAKIDAGEVSP